MFVCVVKCLHPISSSDCKRELSKYPFLAALDIAVDKDWQFPELLLAVATVYRTITNARLQPELTMGCSGHKLVC